MHFPTLPKGILLAIIGSSVTIGASVGFLFFQERNISSLAQLIDVEHVQLFIRTENQDILNDLAKKENIILPSTKKEGEQWEVALLKKNATGSTHVIIVQREGSNEEKTITFLTNTLIKKPKNSLANTQWYTLFGEKEENYLYRKTTQETHPSEKTSLRRANELGASFILNIFSSKKAINTTVGNDTKGTIILGDVGLPQKKSSLPVLRTRESDLRVHAGEALLKRWSAVIHKEQPTVLEGIQGIIKKNQQDAQITDEMMVILARLPYAYSTQKTASGETLTLLSTIINNTEERNTLVTAFINKNDGHIQKTTLPKGMIATEIVPQKERKMERINGWTIFETKNGMIATKEEEVILTSSRTVFEKGMIEESEQNTVLSFKGDAEDYLQILGKFFPFLLEEEKEILTEYRIPWMKKIHVHLSSHSGLTIIEWELL
jgi:hypothetical protein